MMKKCPGKIEMTKGKIHRYVLSEKQKEWLKKYFPTVENCRLAKAMGVTPKKIHDFALDLGLKKSEKGLKVMKQRQVRKMLATNKKNGCYERKRGKPCSKATMAGVHRRWAEEKAGLRENARLHMRRSDPEKYMAWSEKCSKERKESIRKEKLRVIYGMERKTNLKMIVMKPFTQSQRHHRYNALNRGYLLNEDCTESSPDRYIIFYDEDTERSDTFECNCRKDGFKICKW